MAPLMRLALLASLACGTGAARARSQAGLAANPIRRVITMLQAMQQKVVEEGKEAEKLFDKFMCYCKQGSGDLESSITTAQTKLPQLKSSLEEATASVSQLETEVIQHKQDSADAKASKAEADALREKEAAAFAAESADAESNIAALTKAIASLERGTGSFLQTSAAAVLQRLSVEMEMSNADRDVLSSFLTQDASYTASESQSGVIIGILKQMKETMEKDLSEKVASEDQAKADYGALVAAKKKEIAASTKAIEEKLVRKGDKSVNIETLKEDLSDTSKSLTEDEKFLADFGKTCKTKEAEWEEVKKTRAEELVALGETIKILNSDESLELFKKTLPSPSFVQIKVNAKEMKRQAIWALQAARRGDADRNGARLDLLLLALHGRTADFSKIIAMIDDMGALLTQEQADDDSKKAYCEAELDKAEDDKKVLDRAASDLDKAKTDASSMSASLEEEIAAMEKGVEDLDEHVKSATENRKEEHAEYSKTLSSDTAAKEVLELAIERLQKFYNPALAKSLVQVQDRNEAWTGRSARAVPPPPPETFQAYTKKGEESAGVLEMMNVLTKDLDKEVTQIKVEERDAQQEYEELMADSADKRAADAKSIEEKESALADLKAEIHKMEKGEKSKKAEAMATAEIIRDLHAECDWLVANFDTRKDARSAEADSLKNAKAVLSGADYS